MTLTTIRLPVRDESDVVMARKHLRALARSNGLSEGAVEALATAVTEVARNIVVHAWSGDVQIAAVDEPGRAGIIVVATDTGPGITDPERAMEDGYSTAEGLGFGLAGARRLVDEFELSSQVGKGTVVTMKKWITEPFALPVLMGRVR